MTIRRPHQRLDRAAKSAEMIRILAERSHSIGTLARVINVSGHTAIELVRKLASDGIVTTRKTGEGQGSPHIVTLAMSVDDAIALAGLDATRPRRSFDALLAAWPMPASHGDAPGARGGDGMGDDEHERRERAVAPPSEPQGASA